MRFVSLPLRQAGEGRGEGMSAAGANALSLISRLLVPSPASSASSGFS
ncbi:hypothetical protein [Lysobacter gummosus]